jgi:hypothetical protein
MIEKYYAAHIKTSLGAAAINVMRTRKNQKGKKAPEHSGFAATSGAGNGCVDRATCPISSCKATYTSNWSSVQRLPHSFWPCPQCRVRKAKQTLAARAVDRLHGHALKEGGNKSGKIGGIRIVRKVTFRFGSFKPPT